MANDHILNALSHGIIATDVSGIPEIIEDGVTGSLIPQKDDIALARAVVNLVKDRKTAIRMAEEGRSRVLEKFNPKQNHGYVLKLYEGLLSIDQKTERRVQDR